MPKENALITQESTEVVLRKATNIMNRTNKILKNSKKALATHPDVMMINGLMWQKETVEEEMNWDDAMEYAKNLRLGGYDDWRLPTIEEFKEIIISCGCIPITIFEMEKLMIKNLENKFYHICIEKKEFLSSTYWSSKPFININFFECLIKESNYSYYIRCVREAK